MANLIQQKQKELLTNAIIENPELAKGKRLCGIFCLVWILTRAVHLAIELILAFTIDASLLSPANITVMVMVILISYSIYNGTKGFVFLPILGGVLMTSQIFTSQIYPMLGTDYVPIVRIYALAFIIASIVQLVFPIVLLTVKSSKAYLDKAQAITKEVAAQSKNKI